MFLEQRGNSWRAVVRIPGGKKISATRDTQAEAIAWANEQETSKSVGTLHKNSRITAGELFVAFLGAVASKTDSKRWNTHRLTKWCLDPIAEKPLCNIITHDINEWISNRLLTVTGPSVNRELTLMSSAFNYAINDRKWITVNPCKGARRGEKGRPRGRTLLTQNELEAICVATGYNGDPTLKTKMARAGACFLLSLETGARSGELLRARPGDYWKDKQTLHISALEPGGRKGSRSGTTSGDPSRNVPLTGRAMELLDQLLAHRPANQPYIVGLTDNQRDNLWRKGRDRSGVIGLKFHDSKHEAATRLATFIDVLALSHAIGTKDISILRDTYYDNDASRMAALLPHQLSLHKPASHLRLASKSA